jgi:hypothetical protein
MAMLHLDQLVSCQGTAKDEALKREYQGRWRVITVRTVTDGKSTALGKEEMAVHLWPIWDE